MSRKRRRTPSSRFRHSMMPVNDAVLSGCNFRQQNGARQICPIHCILIQIGAAVMWNFRHLNPFDRKTIRVLPYKSQKPRDIEFENPIGVYLIPGPARQGRNSLSTFSRVGTGGPSGCAMMTNASSCRLIKSHVQNRTEMVRGLCQLVKPR